ncbi:sensor histidine kinase [Embleya sp. MST-111070]|uniref:sensor histidine kinase n=1 Tax=Embleya sp. MST-111070 TaxID=3398231 RepID=UPI003F73A777
MADTGTELSAGVIPTLFEPFRRAGPARPVTATGAGLGLTIVRSICVAHGGSVDAEPRAGGGLIVRVELPPAPPGFHAPAAPSADMAHTSLNSPPPLHPAPAGREHGTPSDGGRDVGGSSAVGTARSNRCRSHPATPASPVRA